MEVIYLNTQNILVAKDMLIRAAIKAGLQYVEMENEVIIEYNYLFRFICKEKICFINQDIINILNDKLKPSEYKIIDDFDNNISFRDCDSFTKFKKNDYKMESKRIKSKIKTKIDYRRKY